MPGLQKPLDKSPEVQDLLKRLRKAAPHLTVSLRDRRKYRAWRMARGPQIWELSRADNSSLSDKLSHATPLQPIRSKPEKDQHVATGQAIPKRVKRGISGGLVDKVNR